MAENSGKVAIVIALITTAGVLGAKYIEVGGKRSEARDTGASSSSAETPPPSAVPAIDGAWQDQFGSRFELAIENGKLNLTGTNADKRMAGTGTVGGRTVTVAITNTVDPGTIACTGEIASATSIRSSCREPDRSTFEWLLTR